MKTCKKCKTEKEFAGFHKSSGFKDGHFHICKECISNQPLDITLFTDKVLERYWSKVDKTDDCWEWKGAYTANRPVTPNRPVPTKGYGMITINNKSYYAHRIAFLIDNGYLTKGMVIDHICENTLCVRPSHLREMTSSENALRSPRHSKNHGHYPRLGK